MSERFWPEKELDPVDGGGLVWGVILLVSGVAFGPAVGRSLGLGAWLLPFPSLLHAEKKQPFFEGPYSFRTFMCYLFLGHPPLQVEGQCWQEGREAAEDWWQDIPDFGVTGWGGITLDAIDMLVTPKELMDGGDEAALVVGRAAWSAESHKIRDDVRSL